MGGKNGFDPARYAALSDRQIIALLSIEFDDEGGLVSEWSRKPGRDGEPSGSIARAGRELPSPESLGLSDAELYAALAVRERVGVHYLSLFWSVWKKRGKTNDEIMALWRAHLASSN